MAKIIVSKMPAHRIYCEPFFGMGGVLLSKPPSQVEIINDISNGIVTLFKVARDPELCKELIRRLELTPHARAEHSYCETIYNSPAWSDLDIVEQARTVYVALSQSFTGTIKKGGWSFGGIKYDNNTAQEFHNSIKNIPAVTNRLKSVQIDCQDALQVMERWNCDDCLFYLDPPYVWSSRSQKGKGRKQYEHEMEDSQHIALLDFCLKSKGMFILSGYDSPMYTEALAAAGWQHETFEAFATSAVYTLANGLKGKSQELTKRTEYLWFSPNAAPKTLWNQPIESEAI